METHEHHYPHHDAAHEGHGGKRGKKDIMWMALVALVCLLVGYFAYGVINPAPAAAVNANATPTPTASGAFTVTSAQVSASVGAYVTKLLAAQGAPAGATFEVSSVKQANGLFVVGYSINQAGQAANAGVAYVSADGKQLIIGGTAFDLTGPAPTAAPTATPAPVVKAAKPEVDLFVMSHCPYGTQSEKGILPVVNLLGDKIDFHLRFVYYAMHGDKESKEEITQYCLREQQPAKFLPYLSCFLNASDSAACVASVGVDKANLSKCFNATDAKFNVTAGYPSVDLDKELNTKYSVGGSPTLIINGVESSAGRSPSSYLAGICAAFINPPAECSQVLSSASPSTGFGYAAGEATTASCG